MTTKKAPTYSAPAPTARAGHRRRRHERNDDRTWVPNNDCSAPQPQSACGRRPPVYARKSTTRRQHAALDMTSPQSPTETHHHARLVVGAPRRGGAADAAPGRRPGRLGARAERRPLPARDCSWSRSAGANAAGNANQQCWGVAPVPGRPIRVRSYMTPGSSHPLHWTPSATPAPTGL